MNHIATIRSPFSAKFGIPRQSGIVEELRSEVIFEPEYRSADAVRGLEDFSHIWLIWEFSGIPRGKWSNTVRPPRLGGNTRVGVFATRSPFRPNPIGLSCVRLDSVELDPRLGPVLHISGADLMDGTPIFDIKPYLPYTDCRPEARGGFALDPGCELKVDIAPQLLDGIDEETARALLGVLSRDPRPSYHNDPTRVYGMEFGGMEIRFSVSGDTLTVTEIIGKSPDRH